MICNGQVPHEVLNAKPENVNRESEIIAQATLPPPFPQTRYQIQNLIALQHVAVAYKPENVNRESEIIAQVASLSRPPALAQPFTHRARVGHPGCGIWRAPV